MTIRQLMLYLKENRCDCSKRTVERDLEAINEAGSTWRTLGVDLQCESVAGSRAMAWSHAKNSKRIFLHAMSNEQALMLSLVEQELRHFMPQSAYQFISSDVTAAGQKLMLPSNAGKARFRERVRVVPEGPEIGGPNLDPAHLEEINEALLNEEQIELRYCSARDRQEKNYRLHPVGLVKQGRFYWLLAVKHENIRRDKLLESVQTFRVDRIRGIVMRRRQEVVDKRIPTLDQALESGKLAFFPSGQIALELHFVNSRAGYELCENFRDTPLGIDQEIFTNTDGSVNLNATVRHTRQLVWMLQGVAHLVQVKQPGKLRNEINSFVTIAAKLQLGADQVQGVE